MADRVPMDMTDRLLRSGHNPGSAMEFLQLLSNDVMFHNDDFSDGVLTSSRYTSHADAGTTAFAILTPTASDNHWASYVG